MYDYELCKNEKGHTALAVMMRILLMMMMDMKILMARMMWMIDYEVCASGTGRDVEDDDSERDDDHYDFFFIFVTTPGGV